MPDEQRPTSLLNINQAVSLGMTKDFGPAHVWGMMNISIDQRVLHTVHWIHSDFGSCSFEYLSRVGLQKNGELTVTTKNSLWAWGVKVWQNNRAHFGADPNYHLTKMDALILKLQLWPFTSNK